MVLLALESAGAEDDAKGRVARRIVRGRIGSIQHVDDVHPLPADQLQWRIRGHRPQIDEDSAVNKDSPGFLEGMNHALMRHSSE